MSLPGSRQSSRLRQDCRSEDQIEADFTAYFAVKGYPKVGPWLWGKPKAIRDPLLKLLRCPVIAKAPILAAVTADADFEGCFWRGQLQSSTLTYVSEPASTFKSLLLSFYSSILLVSKGVPGEIVGEVADFDRHEFLRRFILSQHLQVCPGCDGAPPTVEIADDDDKSTEEQSDANESGDDESDIIRKNDKVRENVDHFLPKSKYPFFAVHPLNLVPLCKTCNQEFKKEKDALSDSATEIADILTTEHVFHPYLRPACEEVATSLSLSEDRQKPRVTLRPTIDGEVGRARVKSLNYLLRLENRWSGELRLDRLDTRIVRDFQNCTNQDELALEDISDEYLAEKFRLVCSGMEESIGKDTGYVLTLAFAQWLTDEPAARDERIRLVRKAIDGRARRIIPRPKGPILVTVPNGDL